MQLVFQLV